MKNSAEVKEGYIEAKSIPMEELERKINYDTELQNTSPHDWDILPCEGVYKLSSPKDKIAYSYCQSAYWKCPVKNCIMKLV